MRRMLLCVVLLGLSRVFVQASGQQEVKIQQYRQVVAAQDDFLPWLERAANNQAYNKDNIAVVRISGDTYMLCSSIINGRFFKSAIEPDSHEYDNFSPITVLDLLYMYDPNGGQMKIPDNFHESLEASRNDEQRLVFERILKIAISRHAQGAASDIVADLQAIKDNGDADLGGIFASSSSPSSVTVCRRERALRTAIFDFINRLKQYTDDICFIPDSMRVFGDRADADGSIFHKTHHLESKKAALVGRLSGLLNSSVGADELIQEVLFTIGSPWTTDLPRQARGAREYQNAITHTEQMVDWIERKFSKSIRFKLTGKAPCLKCSHYIQYADNVDDHVRVRDLWNERTVIGLTTGWNMRNMSEIMDYAYPIKVFHARQVNTGSNPWQIVDDGARETRMKIFTDIQNDLKGSYVTVDVSWDNKDGAHGSNCYAIDEFSGYTGQLQMQSGGSVKELERPRGDGDPLLVLEE